MTDFKKEREQWKYRRNILEALVVSAAEKETGYRLPTIPEFILSEVVNGTVAYIGGNAGKIEYSGHDCVRQVFEFEIFKYFKEEMETHSLGKLNPKIKKAVTELCADYQTGVCGPDGTSTRALLYNQYSTICPLIMRSTFDLPYSTIERVREKILPSLSSAERKSVLGVSEAMKEYVRKDIKHISKNFLW